MGNAALILASKSPRRHQLLEQIGVNFRVLAVDLDEARLPGEDPETYVLRLARDKAHAARARNLAPPFLPVLGADTAVVVGKQVLGKPRDRAEGLAMMQTLSGRTHLVLSGIALLDQGVLQALSVSAVRLREVSPSEAHAYWETGEPCDKAGGYAIQGRGALFVAELRGSYSGVMGLPLFETAELLAQAGIHCLAK